MKNLIALTLLGAALATPAFAETTIEQNADAQAGVQSDSAAVAKDDAALARDHKLLKKHRAHKAHAKATGDAGAQAAESVKIGVDHTKIGEKKLEKNVDEEIKKNNDKDEGEDKN